MIFLIPTIIYSFFAIPAAIVDFKTFKIPNILTYVGSIILLIFFILFDSTLIANYITSGMLSFFLFWGLRLITGNGLGFGDVKFSFLCGIYCGIPAIFYAYCISACTGLLYFAFLALKKKYYYKAKIPFCPFLVIGSLLSSLFIK